MKIAQTLALFSLSLVFADSILAEDVKIAGVHLCCGKCVTGAKQALAKVEGVSKIRVNKTDETVIFEATDTKSATSGLKSLAAAGFYGATETSGPDFGVDPFAKKDSVTVTAMHLCCGGCITAAETAIGSVAGVTGTDVSAKAGQIEVTGSGISLSAVLKALHAAGFHGDVK